MIKHVITALLATIAGATQAAAPSNDQKHDESSATSNLPKLPVSELSPAELVHARAWAQGRGPLKIQNSSDLCGDCWQAISPGQYKNIPCPKHSAGGGKNEFKVD